MSATGRTYRLFSNATGSAIEDGPDGPHQLQMNPNADATAQFYKQAGDTWTVRIEGRINDTLPWGELLTTASSALTINDTLIASVRMMPHMRCVTTVNTDAAIGDIEVWIMN